MTAEAGLRRDRTGEPIEPQTGDPSPVARHRPHDIRCNRGWLGYDDEGRPIPCRRCKPHLDKLRNDLNRTLWGPT